MKAVEEVCGRLRQKDPVQTSPTIIIYRWLESRTNIGSFNYVELSNLTIFHTNPEHPPCLLYTQVLASPFSRNEEVLFSILDIHNSPILIHISILYVFASQVFRMSKGLTRVLLTFPKLNFRAPSKYPGMYSSNFILSLINDKMFFCTTSACCIPARAILAPLVSATSPSANILEYDEVDLGSRI